MYEQYFDLREKPFKLVPNPDYLYFSPSHARALSHLRYASAHGDGFVLITGEVGTGKTTLCRCYLSGLSDEYESAYIFNTKIDTIQLLHAIIHEFGITVSSEAGYQTLLNAFNQFLMNQHQLDRKVVLLIDEAQNLTSQNLEMVRLLSNLETTRHKLLHIVLVGQPELAEKLESYALRQLAQRISLCCRLELLTKEQTQAFIKHRVMVAAKGPSDLFSAGACRLIHRYSQGIPRRINVSADRALLKAYELKQTKVRSDTVAKAIHELQSDSKGPNRISNIKTVYYAVIAVAVCAALLWFAMNSDSVGSAVRAWYGASGQDNIAATQEGHPETTSNSQSYKISIPSSVSDSQPQANESPEAAAALVSTSVPVPERQMSTMAPNDPTAHVEPMAPPQAHILEEPIPQHPIESQEGGGSFAEQISVLKSKTSRLDALAILLGLWQQPSPNPGQLPESMTNEQFFHIAALQYGLRLLTVQNDWSLVQRLNLPAIVALESEPAGETVFATLVSWRADEMQIATGIDQYQKVDPVIVRSMSSSSVYIFWYHSLGTDEIISNNDQGEEVLKMKKILRQIGYRHLSLNSIFDPPTHLALVDFQLNRGIKPDGLVGPMTKIMLMAVSDTAVIPHLDDINIGAGSN